MNFWIRLASFCGGTLSSNIRSHIDVSGTSPEARCYNGTPCWIWNGSRHQEGYGRLQFHNRTYRITRIVLGTSAGRTLLRSELACHHCDNPPCCNPDHLFVGDHQANEDDKCRKNRQAVGRSHGSHTHPERRATSDRHGSHTHPERWRRGEANGASRFHESESRKMFQLYASGYSQSAIARIFHTTQGTVWTILRGRCWRHLGLYLIANGTVEVVQ